MTISDMLENLGLYELLSSASDEDLVVLGAEVQVHQQPNYPLRGRLANARYVDGVVQLASGPASEYGDRDAWEEG